jgi:hypothetical protein
LETEIGGLKMCKKCIEEKIKLKKCQDRDKFKVDKCKELGICLIVIPYWIKEEDWVKEIETQYNTFINTSKKAA